MTILKIQKILKDNEFELFLKAQRPGSLSSTEIQRLLTRAQRFKDKYQDLSKRIKKTNSKSDKVKAETAKSKTSIFKNVIRDFKTQQLKNSKATKIKPTALKQAKPKAKVTSERLPKATVAGSRTQRVNSALKFSKATRPMRKSKRVSRASQKRIQGFQSNRTRQTQKNSDSKKIR